MVVATHGMVGSTRGTRRYLTAKGRRVNGLFVLLGGPPHARPLEGATPTLSVWVNPGLQPIL